MIKTNDSDISLQVVFKGEVMVAYIKPDITYQGLQNEIREICKFQRDRPFTIKFIDDEGDPCTISSQEELDEAIYLHTIDKEQRMLIHIFAGVPLSPGLPAPGEDKTIYRRGARRWKKLYKVNGHIFQPKRFNKRAFCSYCQDRIFGLGRQGFKCNNCKLMVHKKCHKFIKLGCLGHPDAIPINDGRNLKLINGELMDYEGIYHGNDDSMKKKRNNLNQNNDDQCINMENSSHYSLNDFNLLRVIGRGSYAKGLDNVLLDHEGHIKLTDYGMCKENISRRDVTSTFCGTPNYISPEQLNGCEYNFSVDWWALGVLLFEMLAGKSPFDLTNAPDGQEGTEEYLFQVIKEKVIRIPRELSPKAQSVLKGFLQKNPEERLGCNIENGFQEIERHQFFKSINFKALEAKQITPPYKPKLESERDLEHFDPSFTNEPVILTPDLEDPRMLADIDQGEFDGFEYVNPLLMSLEDCV